MNYESIRNSVTEKYPSLPPFLNKTVNVFCQTHMYYSAFMQGRLFAKVDAAAQGEAMAIGAAMQMIGGQWEPAAYALNILLASKCAIDLLSHYRCLDDKYRDLRNAIRGQYPLYHHVPLLMGSETKRKRFLSPSFSRNLQLKMANLNHRIKRIALCFASLMWQTFQTSMSLRDVYLISKRDPRACFEAYTTLVASRDDYGVKLQENALLLKDHIKESSGLAVKILGSMGIEDLTEERVADQMDNLMTAAAIEFQKSAEEAGKTIKTVFHSEGLSAFSIQFSPQLPKYDSGNPNIPKYPAYGGQHVEEYKNERSITEMSQQGVINKQETDTAQLYAIDTSQIEIISEDQNRNRNPIKREQLTGITSRMNEMKNFFSASLNNLIGNN